MAVAALATGIAATQLFVAAVLLEVNPGLVAAVVLTVAALWGPGFDIRRQTATRYALNLTLLAPSSFAVAALLRMWAVSAPASIIPVVVAGALFFVAIDAMLVILAAAARGETSLASMIRRPSASGAR